MKYIRSFLIACALLVAGVSASHAVIISSVTASITPTASLLLHPKESLTYTLSGTFTGRAVLEKSDDGTNYELVLSSTNNSNATKTGVVFADRHPTYYRWRGSTITAGSFVFGLRDNDDLVDELHNRKGEVLIKYTDDGVQIKGNLSSQGVLPSTDTTSGNSSGQSVKAYLAGTVAAVEGSLLVATTPVAGTGPIIVQGLTVIVGPATNDLTNWLGVAKTAASTGTLVDVYYSGFVLARTTGTVVPGDSLVSTTAAAGYLTGDSTPTTGADVAIAITAGTAAGGLTKVRLK